MDSSTTSSKTSSTTASLPSHRFRLGVVVALVLLGLTGYVAFTYEFLPSAWRFVERRHPALSEVGVRAFTSAGIPGDPLNVAFVGTESELQHLMLKSHWFAADPITLRSSLRIALDSVVHKPYDDAPVSDLFVNGRRQDLAFEQAAHGDPSRRHHVRFWMAERRDALDRAMWIGAATFDVGVGLSHTTGQITHHIAAEVDQERDKLLADLQSGGQITVTWIEGFQTALEGKNGGGDHYRTDGRLALLQPLHPDTPVP
ncbi:MAG: LssY C-terminal domain-containing protein [Burkholderiaceae bacterium]|nr:LssY C-terminal domain-containing protein [Burkholderiaceae bacterium]